MLIDLSLNRAFREKRILSFQVTECEIFLSLIVKFLDPDKPVWQRALALEVIHKMVVKPELLISFCKFYDLKDHATNIFQDMINSLGAYVQSLFINSQMASTMGMLYQIQPNNEKANIRQDFAILLNFSKYFTIHLSIHDRLTIYREIKFLLRFKWSATGIKSTCKSPHWTISIA